MIVQMQMRRGTAAQWGTLNPVLDAGEWGLESDTKSTKIGDGVTPWNDLDYFADVTSLTEEVDDSVDLLTGLSTEVDAIGVWEAFTPVFTGPTSVSSVTARFCRVGKLITVRFSATMNFPAGSTVLIMSLPTASNPMTYNIAVGRATVRDSGVLHSAFHLVLSNEGIYFLTSYGPTPAYSYTPTTTTGLLVRGTYTYEAAA